MKSLFFNCVKHSLFCLVNSSSTLSLGKSSARAAHGLRLDSERDACGKSMNEAGNVRERDAHAPVPFGIRMARVAAMIIMALVIGLGNAWGATVTFDLTTTTQITTQTQNSVVFTNGSATISISKSASGTRVDNYMPGGNTNATHTRTYNTNPITVNAGSGNTISSIEITS